MLLLTIVGVGCTSAPPARFAGSWTRDTDGAVFAVEDDGQRVTGKLESDPKRNFDDITFALTREGGLLIGKATLTPKGSVSVVTAWRVKPDDGRLIGENEWVLAYPDTGKVVERGTERQVFKIGARSAGAPTDEARRLREEADRTSKAADSDEAARKALRESADTMSDEADKEETEMQRLQKAADTLVADEKH